MKPFRGKTGRTPLLYDTTLGPETEMKGNLSWTGSLAIRGAFSGTLGTDGHLCVDSRAECDVTEARAGSARIAGKFRGTLVCEGLASLERGSEFAGNLSAGMARIEGGATFKGGFSSGFFDSKPLD